MRTRVSAPHLFVLLGVILFVLSTGIFVVSLSSDLRRLAMERWENVMSNGVGEGVGQSQARSGAGSFSVTTLVSLSASFGSLVAFLSTTMLAWRKERRDARLNSFDLEKIKLEIAKLRADLD